MNRAKAIDRPAVAAANVNQPTKEDTNKVNNALPIATALEVLRADKLLKALEALKAEIILLTARFWGHVDQEHRPEPTSCHGFGPCLIWTGATQQSGYAVMKVWRKVKRASHVAWFLAYGVWPDYLCHACDNRLCVAVDHLINANASFNAYDRRAKQLGGIRRNERLTRITGWVTTDD